MGKQTERTRIKVNSRPRGETDQLQEILKTNSLEDLSWLCSLSESELDMIIELKMLAVEHPNMIGREKLAQLFDLKMLAVQYPKMIGNEKLAQKFDLKMLRALAFVLMENNKEKLDLPESVSCIGSSNLLKVDNKKLLEEEEIKECLGVANSRKRRVRRKT